MAREFGVSAVILKLASAMLALWAVAGGAAAYFDRPWIALLCGVMAGGSLVKFIDALKGARAD